MAKIALLIGLLDGRTALLSGAMVAGFFTPVMLAHLRIRKTYPGYRLWAFAEMAFAIELFLQAMQGIIPEWIPVVFGNPAIACAMLLLTSGIRRFTGRKTPMEALCALSALFLAIMYYFYFVHRDLRIRAIIISAFLSFMAYYAACPLLHRPPKEQWFSYRIAAYALLFGSLLGAARVAVLIHIGEMPNLYLETPANTAYFVFDLLFIIGITFAFFLLTNERALADLHQANQALGHEVQEHEKTSSELRAEMRQRKKLEQRLKLLSKTDELTGTLNRRGLHEALKREVQRSLRLDHPLTVLVLDLDNFKSINDRYEHAGGDAALAAFVAICKANLRSIDTLGRQGGDEFVALLPETPVQAALQVAEKLRLAIQSAATVCGDNSITMTVSVGVAAWTQEDANGRIAIAQADQALFQAKNQGRNQVELYQDPRKAL